MPPAAAVSAQLTSTMSSLHQQSVLVRPSVVISAPENSV